MTKITLTWQQDSEHSKSYEEEVELSQHFLKIPSVDFGTVSFASVSADTTSSIEFGRVIHIAVAMTLDNCIDQLLILKAFINEPICESRDQIFSYRTLKERFTLTPKAKQRKQEEEFEKIICTDCQKFQDDILFICTTIRETSKEIVVMGQFKTLINVIRAVKQQEYDNVELERSCRQKQSILKNIKETILMERNQFETQLQETKEAIFGLKNTYEDVYGYGKNETRYLVSWEYARQHQNDLVLFERESVYKNTIEGHQRKIDLETRVHEEIENFILENTADLQNAVLFWMHHYDEEIDMRDSNIIILKSKWEYLNARHIELQNTFEEHKEFISYWLEIKEERRLKEELEQLRFRAAVRIQAWWRGTMVRKKLGPFRVKRGKKGDKKKGKGKQKGKGKKK